MSWSNWQVLGRCAWGYFSALGILPPMPKPCISQKKWFARSYLIPNSNSNNCPSLWGSICELIPRFRSWSCSWMSASWSLAVKRRHGKNCNSIRFVRNILSLLLLRFILNNRTQTAETKRQELERLATIQRSSHTHQWQHCRVRPLVTSPMPHFFEELERQQAFGALLTRCDLRLRYHIRT